MFKIVVLNIEGGNLLTMAENERQWLGHTDGGKLCLLRFKFII